MRQYGTDSPEAIARIVALSLMADGAIDLSELESIQRNKIISALGLSNSLFDKVTHEFCEDMLIFGNRTAAGQYELDPESIDTLLKEIRDPFKQNKLLSSILTIVNAEGHVLAGECLLVSRALKVWHPDSVGAPVVKGSRDERMLATSI